MQNLILNKISYNTYFPLQSNYIHATMPEKPAYSFHEKSLQGNIFHYKICGVKKNDVVESNSSMLFFFEEIKIKYIMNESLSSRHKVYL